jgi:large subunit ribosomal protein L10e
MSYARKDYVPGAPRPKIVRYTMGSSDEFECSLSLVAKNPIKVTSRAIESARITGNKYLENNLTTSNYRLQIRVYPHEIIRQHKQMAFAGADRLSQGMRKAFGRPTGRAARLSKNQAIITVAVNKDDIDVATTALIRASKKLPSKWNVQTSLEKNIL